MKLKVIALILAFTFFLAVSRQKQFKLCTSCASTIVYTLPAPKISPKTTHQLMDAIQNNGQTMDPSRNLGVAKGKRIGFKQLQRYCPEIVATFSAQSFVDKVSAAVGYKLSLAPPNDEAKMFARLYKDENDYLDWHYDGNYTQGRRVTLVIPLLIDACNTSEFQYKDTKTGQVFTKNIQVREMVAYEGDKVYHRITNQSNNCKRLVVIVPLYENSQITMMGNAKQQLRNFSTKFFTF